MGFLDWKSKKAAKIFLKNHHLEQYLAGEEWDDMSIAEREKIFKDYFSDPVMDLYTTNTSPSSDDGFGMRSYHTFTFTDGVNLYNFGKMVVKNPEKEAKKEFSELPEILRADITQLFIHGYESDKMQNEKNARLQRMDDSNKGLGLNRSGNARFTDTWTIRKYSFTCTVEYWGNDDTANASWFVGTDKKIGGASIPCYAIHIKIDPMPEYDRLQEIHNWIRRVRPFKGHFAPGDIFQYWKTNQTGQEEEILKEIRPCLLYGFAGVPYERDRTDTQLTAIAKKAGEESALMWNQIHERWVRSGGPERKAAAEQAAAKRRAIEEVAAKAAAERQAIEERAAAAVAKENVRQDSFTTARYAKQAKAGSWWNRLSENERIKCIASKSDSYYEKVLDGDLGAIPKPTQNFDEIFASAKDVVVDWYMGRDAKEPPTKRRVA